MAETEYADQTQAANLDPRPPRCSCHPDDRPPICQREHATTHCLLSYFRSENTRLREALTKTLNYIENTENELGIELESGDFARAALNGEPS